MSTILRRATDQQQSEWRPVPEGLWRWRLNRPEITKSQLYDNYRVKFPLTLTDDEKKRLEAEAGPAPDGVQQSWRTSYSVGLSLGYVMRTGEYKSTKLVDFLAACVGSTNGKKFREWIASGGGPATEDSQDEATQLQKIDDWLGWWEDLEVYGTVRHEADKQQAGVVWSRFAGPLPVGSLPGQKDDAYQALGRGKLRALIASSQGEVIDVEVPRDQPTARMPEAAAIPPKRSYEDVFGADDGSSAKPAMPDDLPF